MKLDGLSAAVQIGAGEGLESWALIFLSSAVIFGGRVVKIDRQFKASDEKLLAILVAAINGVESVLTGVVAREIAGASLRVIQELSGNPPLSGIDHFLAELAISTAGLAGVALGARPAAAGALVDTLRVLI